jgi:outer membrane protein assembly factor BamB
VLWKVELPGASYGAPIVVGENVYVASDPGELLCIRRKDGKVLWRKGHDDVKATPAPGKGGRGGFGGKGGRGGMGGRGGGDRTAGNTAATPVSNGKYVAALFGNGVVSVYDPEGERVWAKFIEAPRIDKGLSASPLLSGEKLIVHIKDLLALDLSTGKEVWRAALSPTHASPVLARLGKEDVVISPAGAVVRVSDGKVLGKGPFRSADNSPVVAGDTVYVSGRGAFKLSLTGEGELKVDTLWSMSGGGGDGGRGGGRGGMGGPRRFPSPLVHDGLLYTANNSGILEAFDLKSGESVYRRRLPVNDVYASLAFAGGLIYVLDRGGKAVVFKPGRTFETVAQNQLEGTGSCPVFAGDHLYVRGRRNLYCLSGKAAEEKPKD